MAVTLKLPFFEDQVSVTATGYSEAGSLLQSSIALTESAVPGLYTGSLAFATFPVGYYDMRIYIGAATVASASWAIRVTADATTAEYADSIGELRRWATNQTEHDATQASLASLASTGHVTVVSPVDSTGKITGAIVIGDDYLAANSRAFSWTIPAISGVTVGTAIASFGGKLDADNTWLVTGTITVDGANWVLSFDLPKTATASLDAGYYAWSVEVASASGAEITRVRSDVNQVQLVEKQT
jgi:hypothetical protein